MCPMDGLRQLEVSIDSMIVCASIFSCLFSVRMYYCIELSAGFALHKFSLLLLL